MTLTDDHVAMRDLAARYCSAVDDGDAARMAGLFVPEGRLIVYPAGTRPGDEVLPLREWRGVTGFARLIGILSDTYLRWVHFLGNHWVDIGGDRAAGEAYLFACHLRQGADGREEEEVAIIRYRDRYVRTEGEWRFETRRAYRQWTTVRPIDSGSHEIDVALRRP